MVGSGKLESPTVVEEGEAFKGEGDLKCWFEPLFHSRLPFSLETMVEPVSRSLQSLMAQGNSQTLNPDVLFITNA